MRYLSILLLVISLQVNAQWKVGVFAEPSLQFSRLGAYDGPERDSIKAIHNNDFGLGYGIEISKNINRDNSIHFRPGYYRFGFELLRENLQLFDIVHSQFGPIFDQSQAATKIAYMHHRFSFAGLQVDYHRDISPKTKNLDVDFHVGGGLSYFVLLDHHIFLKTEGFAIDGDFTHTIKEDLYFEAKKHMLTAQALFETVYHPTPAWDLYAQVNVKVPFTRLTSSNAPVYNWMPALSLGLRTQI